MDEVTWPPRVPRVEELDDDRVPLEVAALEGVFDRQPGDDEVRREVGRQQASEYARRLQARHDSHAGRTVDGIRPHKPMTEAEAEQRRRVYEQLPGPSPEMVASLIADDTRWEDPRDTAWGEPSGRDLAELRAQDVQPPRPWMCRWSLLVHASWVGEGRGGLVHAVCVIPTPHPEHGLHETVVDGVPVEFDHHVGTRT